MHKRNCKTFILRSICDLTPRQLDWLTLSYCDRLIRPKCWRRQGLGRKPWGGIENEKWLAIPMNGGARGGRLPEAAKQFLTQEEGVCTEHGGLRLCPRTEHGRGKRGKGKHGQHWSLLVGKLGTPTGFLVGPGPIPLSRPESSTWRCELGSFTQMKLPLHNYLEWTSSTPQILRERCSCEAMETLAPERQRA